MKLIKTASGRTLKVSKKEWHEMGKDAGWLKHSDEEEIIQDIPTAPDTDVQPIGWDPAGAREESKEQYEKQTDEPEDTPEEDLWKGVNAFLTSKETKFGLLTFVTLTRTPKALSPILAAAGWGGKKRKPFLNRVTREWEWSKIVNQRGSEDLDIALLSDTKAELDAHGVDTSSLDPSSINTGGATEGTSFGDDVPEELIKWHNEVEAASKLSDKDKKEKYSDIIRRALEEVGEQTEEDATSEKSQEIVKALLSAASKFHNYSFWNSMMIAISRPNASYVASEGNWKVMGRIPKKDAKRIPIMYPKGGKTFTEDEKAKMSKEELNKKSRVYFGLGTALAFEDTEPISENWVSKRGKFKGQGPFEPPVWQIDSQEATPWLNQLYAATYKWATEQKKFRIDIEGLGITGGYATIGGKIAINDKSDGIVKVSTLFHEIAHQLIHFDPDFKRKDSTKQDRETDAEATAYVVCSHYHIDSKDTPIYLAGFGADKNKIQSRFSFIQKAAIEMFEGIDQVMSEMQTMQGKSPQEKDMEPDELPTVDRVPDESLAIAGNFYGSLGLFKVANISPMPFLYGLKGESQDEDSKNSL